MTWWVAYQWYSVTCTTLMLMLFLFVGVITHARLAQQHGDKLGMMRTLLLVLSILIITLAWPWHQFKAAISNLKVTPNENN